MTGTPTEQPLPLPLVRVQAVGSAFTKRCLDILLATLTLVIAAPILLVASLLIKLTSPGPVIFRQERVGRGERPFTLHKLRTMTHGADDAAHRAYVTRLLREDGATPRDDSGLYKLPADARITRIGHVLRRLSIDELPQLFDVLRGTMSLVGPRPSLPWEHEMLRPEHRARVEVKPGITGLWQVSGRNRLTMLQALELDLEYARNHSLWRDLKILLKTIPVVLWNHGAN